TTRNDSSWNLALAASSPAPGSSRRVYRTGRRPTSQAFDRKSVSVPAATAHAALSHLEFDVTSPVGRRWLSELGRQRTFVRCDQRGCGLSDRDVEAFSFEAWVADLEAVVGAFARNVVSGAHAADRARSRRVPRGTRRLSGVRTPRLAKSVRWGLVAAHPS